MNAKIHKKTTRPLFREMLSLIPRTTVSKAIAKYHSDKYCSVYKTYDQLCSTMFGQAWAKVQN